MDNGKGTRARKAHPDFRYTRTFAVAKSVLCCLTLMVGIGPNSGTANSVPAQQSPPTQSTQDQGEGSRQIVLEEFTKARPASAPATTKKSISPVRSRPGAASAPRYRRKSPPLLAALKIPNLSTAEIGVTIWRLRPSQDTDSGARMLVMDGGQTSHWTPERVEGDQLLRLGDRVRISIESPRAGYLYVVDREQYSDGTQGDALLIFPTTRTRGGDNRVKPGVLIDVPAQDDSTPYFTLRSSHPAYAGEVLTVILVPQPIETLPIGPQPLALPLAEVTKWQKLWSTQAELFEMVGGAGKAWTQVEQAAALTRGARTLTQDEPSPQTIYRVAPRTANGFMVNVPLRCTR